MTLIKSLASYYRKNMHLIGSHRFRPHAINALRLPEIATLQFVANPEKENAKASAEPKPSLPPPPSPPRFSFYTWAKWALGAILTIVLPLWDKKWRTLLRLEGEVEMAAEAVESAAEVVEKVAIVTEKMAANAAQSLPEDAKLKGAALFVEKVSKEVAEEAHLTQDIIHKVDELKEEVEMLIDPIKEIEKHNEDRHGRHKD